MCSAFKTTCCILLLLLLPINLFAASEKKYIVVIGDSLSASYGIEIKQSWVSLLQQRLTQKGYVHQVINASTSGDTTANGLNKLSGLMEKYPNAIFLIELGGNDGLQGIHLKTIEGNLDTMIKTLKKNKHKILLIGVRLPPNYGELYNEQFPKIFQTLARKNHIPLVPLLLKNVDENLKLMQADGIHPTAEAEPILLENVWKKLQSML